MLISDSKTRQGYYKKKKKKKKKEKLWAKTIDEHRCKNPQINSVYVLRYKLKLLSIYKVGNL